MYFKPVQIVILFIKCIITPTTELNTPWNGLPNLQ